MIDKLKRLGSCCGYKLEKCDIKHDSYELCYTITDMNKFIYFLFLVFPEEKERLETDIETDGAEYYKKTWTRLTIVKNNNNIEKIGHMLKKRTKILIKEFSTH